MNAVVTMATRECLGELALFLLSLRKFHPLTPVYVGVSDELHASLTPSGATTRNLANPSAGEVFAAQAIRLSSKIGVDTHLVPCLSSYGAIRRDEMERNTRGVWYATRHTDFMMEKASLLEHALAREQLRQLDEGTRDGRTSSGVSSSPLALFLDCDIVTLSPWLSDLPSLPALIVSPHGICSTDEARWGRYNGGVFGARDPRALFEWRKATMTSRYHDQASIEDVVAYFRGQRSEVTSGDVVELGEEVNFGYWRMFQNPKPAPEVAKDFALVWSADGRCHRVAFRGRCLQSIHTHLFHTGSSVTMPLFNRIILSLLRRSRTGEYDNVVKFVEGFRSLHRL